LNILAQTQAYLVCWILLHNWKDYVFTCLKRTGIQKFEIYSTWYFVAKVGEGELVKQFKI